MTTPEHPPFEPPPISRRRWLFVAGTGLVASTGLAAHGSPAASPAPAAPSGGRGRQRVLRFAHLTDSHVQPERGAGEGLASCLRHARSQREAPELIITGGDLVMDSFASDAARTSLQWDLWDRVLRDGWDRPVQFCLGNHDVWGWDKAKSKTTGDEPGWGKRLAMDRLGLSRPFHRFDRAGWRFFILDSTFPDGDGYIAKLGDEQTEWLTGELEATPPATPVCVVSHMPILSATALVQHRGDEARDRTISPSLMHVDAKRIIALFRKHGNVRLCLSGHLHHLDRTDLHGTAYICGGAVSGAWWKGANDECVEGYGLVDLYDDGSFEHAYVPYGWTARE